MKRLLPIAGLCLAALIQACGDDQTRVPPQPVDGNTCLVVATGLDECGKA